MLSKADEIISDNGYLPDLIVIDNEFSWTKIKPGQTITTTFRVFNDGDEYSRLDWEIAEYPAWGVWNFDPEDGENL